MKRICLILAMGFVAVTSTGSNSLALSRHSTKPGYRITELKALSALKSMTLVGMNDNGDVIANAREGGRSVVAVDLAAGTRSAHLLILQKPSGLTNVSASGINEANIVSAEAWNSSGHVVPFVVFFHGRGHIWWRLPGRKHASYQVAGIAANGDVAGTLMGSTGLPDRAVEWFFQPDYAGPVARPYAAAFSLKRSPGFTRSAASTIWSRGTPVYANRELIGGVQYRGNQPPNRFTLWRWLPRCANEFGCSQPAQSGKLTGYPTALLPTWLMIGGRGRHIYAAGRVLGVDTGSGWRSTIQFTGAGAKLGSLVALPLPTHRGAECFYGANSVSAGVDGKFVGVGGISCIGGHIQPEAVLWHGSGVIKLQSRVPAGSGWRLNDAAAMNSHGQIVGTGTLNGRSAVYLLTTR